MAKNVRIAGAVYQDVPSLTLPLADSVGTAVFIDTSDANAVAGDLSAGKTAYANGQKIIGTGGGRPLW